MKRLFQHAYELEVAYGRCRDDIGETETELYSFDLNLKQV